MALLDKMIGAVTGETGSGILRSLGSNETVRDFRHASKLFVTNNFELAPKYTWLYHVFFNINPYVKNFGSASKIDKIKQAEAGMLVKSVDLPKYKTNNKTYNAYNKKQVVAGHIEYDPVQIVLHDDTANVVRDMWYAYMSYYYRDMDHEKNQYPVVNTYNKRRTDQWGYAPTTLRSENFFTSIQIYSLSNKRFSMYELINPKIDSFGHGRHEASNGTGVMEHTMSLSYETVLYQQGFTNGGAVKEFGKEHYDTQPSPLTPLGGGTKSIMGPGGLFDAANSIVGNMNNGNYKMAALGALRAGKNLQNFNFKAVVKEEISGKVSDALRGSAGGPFNFPATSNVSGSSTPTFALPNFGFKSTPVNSDYVPPYSGEIGE